MLQIYIECYRRTIVDIQEMNETIFNVTIRSTKSGSSACYYSKMISCTAFYRSETRGATFSTRNISSYTHKMTSKPSTLFDGQKDQNKRLIISIYEGRLYTSDDYNVVSSLTYGKVTVCEK